MCPFGILTLTKSCKETKPSFFFGDQSKSHTERERGAENENMIHAVRKVFSLLADL